MILQKFQFCEFENLSRDLNSMCWPTIKMNHALSNDKK